MRLDLEPDCFVLHEPGFLSPTDADRLLFELPETMAFAQHSISLFGRPVAEPRLTAWCGDVLYRYSGRDLPPRPWPTAVAELRISLRKHLDIDFNHVLANLYRDGQDAMGWHADSERCLGRNPPVASISLGTERRFLLSAAVKDRRAERVELRLAHGDLLLMGGATQHRYRHALPRTKAPSGPRLSLTFRRVVGG